MNMKVLKYLFLLCFQMILIVLFYEILREYEIYQGGSTTVNVFQKIDPIIWIVIVIQIIAISIMIFKAD